MILDRFRLDGCVAMITGAGRGIGRGVALCLAELGADVVLASRSAEPIEEVAALARKLGVSATPLVCDVTERASLEATVAAAINAHDRIDVLVNNAGGAPHVPALRTSESVFERALRFNVTQAFLLTRLVVPTMIERGSGSVINISSSLGHVVGRGFVAYGTAKAALEHMTRLLADELAPKVRVNAIACGAIETAALKQFLSNEAIRDGMIARTPLRRVGSIDDVCSVAALLASDAGSYITGKVIEVDGGLTTSNTPFDIPDL